MQAKIDFPLHLATANDVDWMLCQRNGSRENSTDTMTDRWIEPSGMYMAADICF